MLNLTKVCPKCKIEKNVTEFHSDSSRKSGICSWCKKCSIENSIKYRQKNPIKCAAQNRQRHQLQKQRCVDYKGGKCSVCGYNKCLAALEFHHINPEEKEFTIGRSESPQQWEIVRKELDKCICVCANCHQEIHYYNK